MTVPDAFRAAKGPWSSLIVVGDNIMGFITAGPSQVRQVSNLAPPIRVGGDAGYSNESFSQLLLTGFEAGGDRELFETGDKRYQWSDGGIAFREGYLTLASQWASSDPAVNATAREIVGFGPAAAPQPWVVVGAGTTLRALNTTSLVWADSHPAAGVFGANVVHVLANDQYLFVSLGSGVDAQRWDGTGLTAGYAALAGFRANCFGWYKNTLYRALGNTLYKATNNDGSAWSATTYTVGYAGTNISDLYPAAGYLIIAKPEGLYVWDETSVELLVDASNSSSVCNFKGGSEFRGALYLPWINAIHKHVLTSAIKSTVTEITPRMKGTSAQERYGHGMPIRTFGGPHQLYVAFDDGEGLYPEVLAYNDIGWQQYYRGTSGDTMRAAGYARSLDWLFINDGATRRRRIINTGDAEYPDYCVTGEFWTPKLDAGFPDELKAWKSIEVEADDCDADNTITVSYRLDGGSWVALNAITGDGKQELLLGGLDIQKTSRTVEFKIVLARKASDVTKTPKIKMPLVVRVMVSPRAMDALSENLIFDLDMPLHNEFGKIGNAGYTIPQMKDHINDGRNSGSAVLHIDEWGEYKSVKITDMALGPTRVENYEKLKLVCSIKMLDMWTGVRRQVDTKQTITATATATMVDNTSNYIGVGIIGLMIIGGFI